MQLETGTAPVQFLAECFKKRAVGEANEADAVLAFADRHGVAGGEGKLNLAVSGEINFEFLRKDTALDDGIDAHDD